MKTWKQRIGLALALLIASAAVAAIFWNKAAPPQIITLPNGERYRFAGVTYGTNNVPPSFAARLVRWLPTTLGNVARRYVGARITQFNVDELFEKPHLFVWFQPLATNARSVGGSRPLTAMLADQTGVEAGVQDISSFDSGVAWNYASFPALPRRSRVLQCNLYPFGGARNSLSPLGHVRFRNPLYGRFPEWKPESVPAVKMAGSLEVRLENLVTGVRASGRPPVLANGRQGMDYRPARKGEDVETFFDVSLSSPTNEQWVVQGAALSDATGNVLTGPADCSSSGGNVSPMTFMGEYRLSVPGMLWPDEAAWRLKLELKRKSGFAPYEFVTFRNVPVPKVGTTNFVPVTNIVGGVQLVLQEFVENGDRTSIRYPRGTNAGYAVVDRTPETLVAVGLPGHPEGVVVDFVKLTTDAGEQLEKHGNTWRPFYRAASLRFIPANVAFVDITWVVQKTRSVEFLVKPTTAE